ncbi:MAG: tRNA adenosine(34) deaminase TadA [Lachnospiraceae bacterium]|nr:tRNA adenosine(34) deaminase TadA [Lachnospiraceae bacterium]
MNDQTDVRYMAEAMKEARKAYRKRETPIGCVIVRDGKIIARGRNRRDRSGNVLAHAEIEAIRKACRKLKDWRLEGCTMYVTLEPCPMCAGAIVQARMDRLVIGTMSPKAGCAGSILNLMDIPQFNHQVPVTKGVCGDECSRMLTEFFTELRKKK